MNYAHLGRSGLLVSRLSVGTDNFGTQTPEDEAGRILDAALEAGINLVDTSNVYGWRVGEGYTEQIVGNWLAGGGGRRDKVVLATKVYGTMGDWPNEGKLSARHIRQACDASLRRLRTDHIDLYQMHHVDRDTPIDEIWEAMETLRAQGKIIYVGSSNHGGWHIARAQEAARRRNFLGLVSEQSIYNLMQRTIELEVLPAARDYGVGVLAWAPLSAGLLGGILAREREGTVGKPLEGATIAPHRRARFAKLEKHRETVTAYEQLCDDLGVPPSSVATAWVLAQPGITGVILGPRTVDQLTTAIPALDVQLDADTLAELDKLFPPTGQAPEAYAW
jgi:NDP-hexose 2,3-enoyl reductase